MADSGKRILELTEAVSRLCEQGKHQVALELAKDALSLSREELTADIASLENPGGGIGEFGAAATHQLLKLGEAAFPGAGLLLGVLGRGIYAMMEEAERKAQLKRALAIRRRGLEVCDGDTIGSLSTLAQVFQEMGNQERARSFMEAALTLSRHERGAEHVSTASCLVSLGKLLREGGDYVAAQACLEQALAVLPSALGEGHLHTATCRHHLGDLLREVGDLARAWPLLEQALTARRSVLGEWHLDTADSLASMGLLLLEMRDSEGGGTYLQQAITVRRRVLPPDHPEVGADLRQQAMVFRELGDYERARVFLEAALVSSRYNLGEVHLCTAALRQSLGSLYREMGLRPGARREMELALVIRRQLLGEQHPHCAACRCELGGLLRETGDYPEAWCHLEAALPILRQAFGEDHPETTDCLAALALVCAAQGRPNAALPLVLQAVTGEDRFLGQVFAIASERQRTLYLQRTRFSLNVLMSLVVQNPDHPSVVPAAVLDVVLRRKALGAEALATQRDAVLGGRHPDLRAEFDQFTRLRRCIAQKLLAGPAPGETPAAYDQVLRRWREEQAQRETALARQIPEMNLEAQLQKADCRAVALSLPEGAALVEFVRFDVFDFQAVPAWGEAPSPWQPARYLAFVLPAGQPEQVRMIDLGEADPIDRLIAEFRAGITLPPWERHRGQKLYTQDEDSAEAEPPAPAALPPSGSVLRQRLLDPLLSALGNHTHLWLSPDGDLSRLPFELLPAREGGRLLLDTYRISYLAAGRDALRCGQPASRLPGPTQVAADPDFDLGAPPPHTALDSAPTTTASERKAGFWSRLFGCRSCEPVADVRAAPRAPGPSRGDRRRSRDIGRAQPAQRLPATRLEGERVAVLLGVEPLLAGAVLDQPLKSLRSPRILHLATHGFFLEDQSPDYASGRRDLVAQPGPGTTDRLAGARFENPLLRSGLLLAGFNTWRNGGQPPDAAEDGMLTAEDVIGMDLLDTELVVLSACDTGLGEIHVGEGVFGLRRAFAVAGTKTLVMSLWKVPDAQTQELMVDFYSRILRGEGRAEALLQAQQALRTRYPDPYYWGAFICQGDPGPLRA
jgi:CHAT domain-containing protein/tetratricopeptide (TPR) repeat protein